MGLQRLKKAFNIPAFAVISETSMIPLCKKYVIDWCMHENSPLGAKKNFGLKDLLEKRFDFMIELGSDDLLKNELFEHYKFDSHVVSLNDFIVMNSEDGECRRITARDCPFGLGRAISRQAVEAMILPDGNMKMWTPERNGGLDMNSRMRLSLSGFTEKRITTDEPFAIDIKSEVNINPFSKMGTIYEYDKAISGLSDEEVTALKSLHVTV